MSSPFAQLRSYQRNLRYQGYQSVPVEQFGGLRLDIDPNDLGWNGAADLLNVEIQPGLVRARSGYSTLGAATAANIDSILPIYSTATEYEIVGTTTPALSVYSQGFGALQTVNRIGGGTGTTQTASASPHNFAHFGDPTHEYVYIANGTNQIRRFEPSTLTFTEPAGLAGFTGRLVAVTPWDNRLVTEGTTQKSRVNFSDPGAPETIGANNWVDLTPGDGEKILAIESWSNYLFVFKRTKFFVFYGTSTDGSGNPIFNYRTIDAGIGLTTGSGVAGFEQQSVTRGPDGLYFMNGSGIFRTTGGPPQKFSGRIDRAFTNDVSGFTTLGINSILTAPLTWVGDHRLYAGVRCANSGFLDTLFVFDQPTDTWTAFSLPANVRAIAPYRFSEDQPNLVIGAATQPLTYLATPAGSSTDNGTAIASHYRSGFFNVPGRSRADNRQVIRQWKLKGTGTVNFGVAADDATAIPTTGGGAQASVALAGPYPNFRTAQLGYDFSWQVSGTGSWNLSSVEADVA